MESLIKTIAEQFDDIINGFGNHGTFELETVGENVVFRACINDIPFKEHIFIKDEKQTEETLENEIKAYLFDVLDGIVNLS